ncbi:MAG: hypothetical protein HDS03_10430 [Bacteroides sp.]|nr:hypothetical protein [Bacteroides sp.]MDE7440864.1 hypothetical protein [Muribaculaceae bacterium]
MRIIYITLISFIAAGTIFCGCGSRTSATGTEQDSAAMDSLPVDVTDIVKAVATDDSVTFSSHVNYPLERPYPLRDIADEEEMKAYYPVLVDDSLRKVVAQSAPKEWSEAGWRGWTVRDGQYIWIDGDVYEVNYVSAKEKILKDSLIKKEKESLPARLRSGWLPEWVMEDVEEGTLYRIDADSMALAVSGKEISDGGSYRLAVYRKGGDLRKDPERILHGKRRIEGSAGTVNYLFSECPIKEGSDSVEYVIELYSAETGAPRLHHRAKRKMLAKNDKRPEKGVSMDTVTDHDLKKVYWLDKVSDAKRDSLKN